VTLEKEREETVQTPTQSPNSYETGNVKKSPKMAAVASWIGSVLEYYDFFIYGTAAALVFGKVFFPNTNPATGTLLSFATYGAAYVARPVGSIFMGHLGDRYGRKRVLLLTVTLMGLATFLVGCLPTYSDIGITAPVLLVCLRLLQGLAASGEQAGANSVGLEHAPERRRAFYSSFTLCGTQTGLVIATAIWLPISSLPDNQLLTWGWRVPFWMSALVTVVALVIRRKLEETPAFHQATKDGALEIPLAGVLRDHRANLVRVILGALASTVSTIFAVYALSFAVKTVKLDDTTMLWVVIVTNLVALAAIPAWATLADRIGRKPVFIFGAVGSGALMFAYLAAIASGQYALIFLAGIFMSGIVYSAQNGVWPALYGEMFSTRVRLSGTAIGTQIGFAIGGFMPTVAAAIDGNGPDGWVPVAALVLAMSLIAAVAIATAHETFDETLPEIDGQVAEITSQVRRRERPARAGALRHERGMKLPVNR
jgi:MFS family permease